MDADLCFGGLLPMQLPVNGMGEAVEDDLVLGPLRLMWGDLNDSAGSSLVIVAIWITN